MKKFISLLSLLSLAFLSTGFSCTINPFQSKTDQQLLQKITLEYWTVEQTQDNLKNVLATWQTQHPNIAIKIKRFRPEEYEQKLLEGWAINKGPDLYSLPNTWLKKYQKFITPMPTSAKLPFQEIKTTLGKQSIVTTVKTQTLLTANQMSRLYVKAVNDDAVFNKQILGLPLAFDNLALFYNQKLLDAAGLATPPATWTEIKEAVKKLTLIDQNNKINQAGLALGTTNNIANATDIVTAIMLQNGVQMTNENGTTVSLQQNVKSGQQNISPALDALNFYNDFADPLKETYSWNKDLPDAEDFFIQGKLAMFIGFSNQLNEIKQRAPKLDIKVSPLPQIAGSQTPANVANYWLETVSHQSKNKEIAWAFIYFLSQSPQIETILAKTNQTSALRAVIDKQKTSDQDFGIFAAQAIFSQSWYHGFQPQQMKQILIDLISGLPLSAAPDQLLNLSAKRLQQTFVEPK